MTRPWTPDVRNSDGSTTMVNKRACNGCGTFIGDATEQEINRVLAGFGLPDVRTECPACAPTAPEPRCTPATVFGGHPGCLEHDCGHDREPGADYCDQVDRETICVTHSEVGADGTITRAELWPCRRTRAVAE